MVEQDCFRGDLRVFGFDKSSMILMGLIISTSTISTTNGQSSVPIMHYSDNYFPSCMNKYAIIYHQNESK